MCSGSEAGSYLRRIDFVYHSTLGVRVIKKKKENTTSRYTVCRIGAASSKLRYGFSQPILRLIDLQRAHNLYSTGIVWLVLPAGGRLCVVPLPHLPAKGHPHRRFRILRVMLVGSRVMLVEMWGLKDF